jgi:uncharacterized RDD family membrane protein YckC
MEQSYLLVIEGKPAGPFSVEELKQKNIHADDFVKSSGMDDYKQAHEVSELRELFGFKYSATSPQYFGSFDQRLLASAIDWFISGGVFLIFTFIGIILFGTEENRLVLGLAIFCLSAPANFIYHVIMECSAAKGTFGKQLLRIKVCNLQGERINFKQAILRNTSKILSALPFFTGFLWSFFNKKQQCLHDVLAGTLVMKDRLI